MLFWLPHPPLAFEIPDEWLEEAGAVGFKPTSQSYEPVTLSAAFTRECDVTVALCEIAPMLRRPHVVRDHHGFRRQGGIDGGPGGMVDVLRAIVSGVPLCRVQVRRVRGTSAEGFLYVVRDGFHRFYASRALGFTHIPCELVDDFRPEAQLGDEW